MNKKTSQKFLKMQEQLLQDETYLSLMDEHAVRNTRFLEVVETMTEEQRASVYDYLGVLVEMHYRILEIAVSSGAE